ncbi:MAG: helix-turn-helix domain-containing protein [Hyphomicrobiaceae bacterium]|nr:helix-turn-helix domain-containing protein [Hyphomicrobiaceae bacterium]
MDVTARSESADRRLTGLETSPEMRLCWPLSPRPRTQQRAAIESAVAQVFAVAEGDLRRPTRGRARVAFARQVAMYLAHVACGMSLTEVGRIFERDRTTVAYACGLVEDRRDDPLIDRTLELLEWIVAELIERRCGMAEQR